MSKMLHGREYPCGCCSSKPGSLDNQNERAREKTQTERSIRSELESDEAPEFFFRSFPPKHTTEYYSERESEPAPFTTETGRTSG